MNYEDQFESELSLKDLFFHILYRWRSVLAAAVVLCVLISAYKAIRNMSISSEEQFPKKIEEYELELTKYELNVATYKQEIQDKTEQMQQQETYLKKSILMRIDPYQKPVVFADVFIKLENEEWEALPSNFGMDPTDSLIKIYTSNFFSTLDWKPIEELTGAEQLYLEELIKLYIDYSSNTFTICVTYLEGDTAEKILDIIIKQIEDRQPEVAESIAKHLLTVSNRSNSYVVDHSLAENQRNNWSATREYELSILEDQASLGQLVEPDKPFIIGFVKYPVAGFMLGAFLMIAFYGMKYLLDGRLHGELSLQDRYGYPLLGVLPKSEKHRLLSCVDRFLDKHSGCSCVHEQTETYERILINMENLSGGLEKILITGTVSSENLQIFSKNISQQIKGTVLTVAPDMNKNPETLRKLAECDGVLLLEEEGRSAIAEISREHHNIKTFSKPVIGYVLL